MVYIGRDGEEIRPFGYELDADGTPVHERVRFTPGADYGADPLGGGMFRMVPSGDVVDAAEKTRRLED